MKYLFFEANGFFAINLSDSKGFFYGSSFKTHSFLLFYHTIMKKDAT